MFHDEKNKLIPRGDYVSSSEAEMDEDWEIRSRCESVHDVVSQNIMPLDVVLEAYNISLEQYVGFIIGSNKPIKLAPDNKSLIRIARLFLGIIDMSKATFDSHSKKVVEDLQKLAKTT